MFHSLPVRADTFNARGGALAQTRVQTGGAYGFTVWSAACLNVSLPS